LNGIRPVLNGNYHFVLASRTRGEREPGAMLLRQTLRAGSPTLESALLYSVAYSDTCAFLPVDQP
jgi:hypothetical protein